MMLKEAQIRKVMLRGTPAAAALLGGGRGLGASRMTRPQRVTRGKLKATCWFDLNPRLALEEQNNGMMRATGHSKVPAHTLKVKTDQMILITFYLTHDSQNIDLMCYFLP